MFSVRHRSVVSSSRFCQRRPAFRPRACRRLRANSNSAKRPSSYPKTILQTRVGCASSRPGAELNFAGHPTVGTACALVMKQRERLKHPIRLILEENIGPVAVDVAQRNGGFHGTLTLSGKIEAPTGAPWRQDTVGGCGSTGKSSLDESRIVLRELVPIEACRKKSRAGFSSA
jgi:hypothetical protein